MQRSRQLILMSTFVLSVASCARNSVRPDEMSASQHRAEAEGERFVADAHRSARKTVVAESVPPAENELGGLPVMRSGNEREQTDWHLIESARHAYHARQHRAAAEALERSEAVECRSLPTAVRAACPMLTFVAAVQHIEGGVRIRFLPQANVEQIVALMRCHLAFARVNGFDRVPSCPLYMKGVEIRRARASDAIEVTGESPEVVVEIRGRVRDILSEAP